MIPEVECAGAPRDLGLAQGRSCAGAVRRGAPRVGWLARLRPSPERARLDRELWRHHPQVAERLRGLALGAGVPAADLLAALTEDTGDAPVLALERAGDRSGGSPGGPLLARLLPGLGSARAQEEWVLRRSRPDPGFASLELTRPWLPAATAGVNETGLAVVASGFFPDAGAGRHHEAPGSLLVQGALQRFATAAGAAEWLLRRPGGGRGSVVAADASGRTVGVAFDGADRRLLADDGGILVASPPPPAMPANGTAVVGPVSRDVLAKAAREAADGAEGLARGLCAAAPGASALVLAPAARRLLLLAGPEASPLVQHIAGETRAA